MSNIAIVAIPSKTDQVWGISSEKVPHMTLIHLGEALPKTDFQKVADWIEHVADTMLHPFWMQVSERSTLGKKDADVLFFKPDEDSSIQLFRKYLLANSAVREAFETVEQFEGWTPHLTLGYPETPAKKTAFDHEFYGVSFNKIALWVGDYEGPEFQLKEQEDMAIAMSEETKEFLSHFGIGEEVESDALSQSDLDELDAFLAHVGVIGMRWGHRKSAAERRADRTARVQARSEKSIAKSEQYVARAKAKEAAAKAKTGVADAKASEATAKLETKLAKDATKFAKAEARTGTDDPSNGIVRAPTKEGKPESGLVGKSDREAKNLRGDVAKNARTLDDQTLKDYTQRLDTEKKLKNAIREDTAPRRAATKKLLNETGKDLAKKALIGAGSMAIYYLIATKGGKEPYNVKKSAEGMAGLLSGAPKKSGKDAFNVVDWKVPPPPSMNKRKATPF